jgi:hypothetical protein
MTPRLFDISEAPHFCAPLAVHVPGVGQSLVSLHDSLRAQRLTEGSPQYDAHRVSALNSVERWLLFGVAYYRRALEMLIPSAAPWAHVTLYYSGFYAANAILGMFGVWVGQRWFVDVEMGTPGKQTVRLHKKIPSPSGYRGSHEIFWDIFYECCNAIGPWVSPQLQPFTVPVNSDRRWQIRARNEVNYDMAAAFQAAVQFNTTFRGNKLKSVTGDLAQQLVLTEGLLRVALSFANKFDIHSFALADLGVNGKRARVLRTLVTKVPPSLSAQSQLHDLLNT